MAVKLLVLAAVFVATVHAAPGGTSVSSPVQTVLVPSTAIVRTNFHAQDEQGQYAYGYSSEDGQYKKEVKTLDGTVRGLYGYNAPDGRHVLVRYKADDNGFVAESDFVEEPGADGASRPVISLSDSASIQASREGTGFAIQEEVDDINSGVQVDQDAYSSQGYSSYSQDGRYYTEVEDKQPVSPYQPVAPYVSSDSASQTYYATDSPVVSTVDTGSLSDYASKSSGYSDSVNSYSTYSSTPTYYSYAPAVSVGSKSSDYKYSYSQGLNMSPVQSLYSGTPSQYVAYDSKPSGYSDGGSSYYSTYTNNPTYYSYVPAASAGSSSTGYSDGGSSYSTYTNKPTYYTYVPAASAGSSSTGYSDGGSSYSSYTNTNPTYYTYVPAASAGSSSTGYKYYTSKTPVSVDSRGYSQYAGYGTRQSSHPIYDKLHYPSQTSVVYIPQPEQRVFYPKENSYVYSTEKPAYEVRPVQAFEDHSSYKPKTRVAVSVAHHGTPLVAIAPAQVASVTPVPTIYSPSPAVKVHVSPAPPVSAHRTGTFHVTPSPAQVKTVSLSPIHVKVHNPAVHTGYVVSSSPASVKVVKPSVIKTKLVSAATPLKVHYVSPAVNVKSPSVKIQPSYYSLPGSYSNAFTSYAAAGTSPYKLFPYAAAGTSPYKMFPYASYSYLPATSLYGAYQPYYYIQSPMAAVHSNLQQTYSPYLGYSSYAYNKPVKQDVRPVIRHTY